MNSKVIDFSNAKLNKDIGCELLSFQDIKDLTILWDNDIPLVESAVYNIKCKIEDKEHDYIPIGIVLKKMGSKYIIIEGKHAIQAIKEVEKPCRNWNEKTILVRFYIEGEIL
jgi:hypothetical protein